MTGRLWGPQSQTHAHQDLPRIGKNPDFSNALRGLCARRESPRYSKVYVRQGYSQEPFVGPPAPYHRPPLRVSPPLRGSPKSAVCGVRVQGSGHVVLGFRCKVHESSEFSSQIALIASPIVVCWDPLPCWPCPASAGGGSLSWVSIEPGHLVRHGDPEFNFKNWDYDAGYQTRYVISTSWQLTGSWMLTRKPMDNAPSPMLTLFKNKYEDSCPPALPRAEQLNAIQTKQMNLTFSCSLSSRCFSGTPWSRGGGFRPHDLQNSPQSFTDR